MRGTRGFTLIELLVALACALAITAAATGVLVTVLQTHQEAALRNQMARDAELALDHITRDLSYFGAGVPRAKNTGMVPAWTHEQQLRPALRIGLDDNLVFVGDLPYPNAELSGLANISYMRPSGGGGSSGGASGALATRVAVTSEITPCVPPHKDNHRWACDSSQHSLVPAKFTSFDNCFYDAIGPSETSLGGSARACPWSLNKWQKTADDFVYLVFGTVDGGWYERRWNGSSTKVNHATALRVDKTFGLLNGSTGEGKLPREDFLRSGAGLGFIAHLDRVFWSLEGASSDTCTSASPGTCVLWRRQCWGKVYGNGGGEHPGHADWPKVKAVAMREPAPPSTATQRGRKAPSWSRSSTASSP